MIDQARPAEIRQPRPDAYQSVQCVCQPAFCAVADGGVCVRQARLCLVVTPLERMPSDFGATAVINIHANSGYGSGVHVNAVHANGRNGSDTRKESMKNAAYANGANGHGGHTEPIMIISDIDAEGTNG